MSLPLVESLRSEDGGGLGGLGATFGSGLGRLPGLICLTYVFVHFSIFTTPFWTLLGDFAAHSTKLTF